MRALLSVANRDGIASLATALQALGVEVFATSGTRETLASEGVQVRPLEDLTGEAPLLGGRVRTFHPRIYAGILAHRNEPDELASLAEHDIAPLDLVVVNVKPFAPQVGARVVPLDQAIEMIDVAGVALLSAAARNYAGVAAVCDPADYPSVVDELRELGSVSVELRQRLAARAFATVAAYNAEVAAYLNYINGVRFPERLTVVLEKERDLPYGENPHQTRGLLSRDDASGALARGRHACSRVRRPPSTTCSTSTSPIASALDFASTTCAIVKQANPVGLASNDSQVEAYRRALEGDPVSAFGAVIAFNRTVNQRDRRGGRRERVRGRRRSGLYRGRARRPGREGRALRALRARIGRGPGRLRHRRPRLPPHRRRAARRDARRTCARPLAASGGDAPSTNARRADRPALRLARRAPRGQQCGRRGTQRLPGRAWVPDRPAGWWPWRSASTAPRIGRP